MFIIRPSIVGCSYREPYEGWVDNISAAGAMLFFVGLGVIRDGIGDYDLAGDLIPVDYVWNGTLIGTAVHANKNELAVHHSGTSSIHPIYWGLFIKSTGKYFVSVPMDQQFKTPKIRFHPNKKLYELKHFFNSKIPEQFYAGLAKLTFNTTMKKNVARLKKINQKGKMVNYI